MRNENEDDVVVATLDLPVEGYRQWLEHHRPGICVGYDLSAKDNPVARYIYETVGTHNRLHTDGKRAWFLLSLTRPSSGERYVSMILPAWAAPLL